MLQTSSQVVGPQFQLDLMQQAQQWALTQLAAIAAALKPGISEVAANQLARAMLDQAGAQQHWHPPIVRFGHNTCKIYSEASMPDTVLGDDDVFFIDIGPVWQGHEADVGATYAVGQNAQAQAIVQAVDTVFAQVEAKWRQGFAGTELYQFAETVAQQQGYQLNHQIKGHRVGDFPHKLYASGSLGDLDGDAVPGIWVLEIQLKHPTLPIGAFKEQVLF
jgi:Xaa-Pro aminopeptidase